MSEALNQLLEDDGALRRWRQQPLREYSRGMPNPFDLLERAPQSKFDGRESVNVQDWSFMTEDPSPSFSGALRDARARNQEELRQRNMPPTLEPTNKGYMVRSLDYGQAAPEISQQYQEAISTPQNQLLEEVMRSLAMSDSDQVAPNELDPAPRTMDQANEQMMRRAANVFNKQMRMRYPLERSAEGAGIPLP